MDRETLAVDKRNHGYNCAQAVLCSYADMIKMDEKQLFVLSESLGSGLGCTAGTCGALNAASMVLSSISSSGNLDHPDSKGKTYLQTRNLVKSFEKQCGALRCRDIKGIDTGVILCACEDCVRIACKLIDETLNGDNR